jgi:hypothetical protein
MRRSRWRVGRCEFSARLLRYRCCRCSTPGKIGSEVNGLKLTSGLILHYLLTQCLPGFDHQREGLGSSLLDAWLHTMRSGGVDEERSSRDRGVRRAEPPQGIEKADPFHRDLLEPGCLAHDHADQVVDDGEHH